MILVNWAATETDYSGGGHMSHTPSFQLIQGWASPLSPNKTNIWLTRYRHEHEWKLTVNGRMAESNTKHATNESGYELAWDLSSLITQNPLGSCRLYSVCSVNVDIDRISSARYTANLVTAAAEMRPNGRGGHVWLCTSCSKTFQNTVSAAWLSICLGLGH